MIESSSAREVAHALQQAPQAGHQTTHPRIGRAALQTRWHRRRRRDAELTNGAFYCRFASKEDLVANVLADQLRAQRQSFDAQPPDREGLEAFIRSYLSPQHRDQYADGCPSAALLDEIARRPAATKQVFTDELMGVIDDIASRLDPTNADAARSDALTLFGLMFGTLQLARALSDPDLSDQLLARAVETAMKLLNDPAVEPVVAST
jgi:TetR/AcrR family transcriptional regulator, transcriptional repressor for nem operon